MELTSFLTLYASKKAGLNLRLPHIHKPDISASQHGRSNHYSKRKDPDIFSNEYHR